jgi:NitT/TauT family transport system ATP-binding protein
MATSQNALKRSVLETGLLSERINRPHRAHLEEIQAGHSVVIENLNLDFYDKRSGTVKRVLRNINLRCKTGEFVALLGKSGSGKTTILNTLTSLVEPQDQASVQIYGKSPREARGDIGYMLARDALMPWRTAVKNVELSLEMQQPKRPREERRQMAQRMLDRVGLAAAYDLYPWQLSHGMRQRVALARTWVTNPRVLLMDEPFAALDALTRSQARDQFLDIWSVDRKTVVFVTHEIAEAFVLADRVIVLQDGQIQTEIEVPFERPRDEAKVRLDPRYHEFEKIVRQYLN